MDRAPDRWHRAESDPGVALHPDAGFAEGARVRLVTRYGETTARVRLDAALRPDVADLPAGFVSDANALLGSGDVCPITGAPGRDGLSCAIAPA